MLRAVGIAVRCHHDLSRVVYGAGNIQIEVVADCQTAAGIDDEGADRDAYAESDRRAGALPPVMHTLTPDPLGMPFGLQFDAVFQSDVPPAPVQMEAVPLQAVAALKLKVAVTV